MMRAGTTANQLGSTRRMTPFCSAVFLSALPSSGNGARLDVSFTSSTPLSNPLPRTSRTTPSDFRPSSLAAR